MFRDRGIEIKTPAQIETMRRAGLVVGETLELLRRSTCAGITTRELDRIAEADAVDGFLLDGYPRTVAQVAELDKMLEETGHSLDAVVVLTVDKDEVVQRLLKRAQDEGRSDDTEDVMRHRQDVYTEQTAPLIEVYDERGLLVEVDGMGPVEDVTTRVSDALEQTNGAAAS